MKKVLISGMIGNGMEWYDYALYGQMAAILGRLFFPAADPAVQLLATFGVFAVGFVCRPLGAIFFGWVGDRYGRKISLIIAITMMAVPTGCIGLLPTYEQIGVLAPILLTIIRIFQGLSLGGEFSGSIVFIVEHAPPHKRGIAGSATIVSLLVGFILGSLVSMLTAHILGQEAFEQWGWRLPFLFGVAIGFIGFYIRRACDESPAYEDARARGHLSEKPLRDTFTRHKIKILQAFTIYMTVTMPFYLLTIYLITYTQQQLGRTPQEALLINCLVLTAQIPFILFGAWLTDRYGRKPILLAAALTLSLTIYPIFLLMHGGSFATILLAQMLFGLILAFYLGPVPTLLVEIFPTSVRYTGMATAYNLCAALFGGTAPMVSVWLITVTGNQYAIAFYVMACCIASIIALLNYRDRWREAL